MNQGSVSGLTVAQVVFAAVSVTTLVIGTIVGGLWALRNKMQADKDEIKSLVTQEIGGLKLAAQDTKSTIEKVVLPTLEQHGETLKDHNRRLNAVELGDALNTLIEAAKAARSRE